MEVYKSTRTAAEMEYALGAVPSIGENGNWFIGDQDTGIKAGGITISNDTATVGQVISVKAVDDNGKPTEWECVDMSGWKHIATVAVPSDGEEVTSIEITTDEEGNPFSLDEVVINYRITRGDSSTTTNGNICLRFNEYGADGTNGKGTLLLQAVP